MNIELQLGNALLIFISTTIWFVLVAAISKMFFAPCKWKHFWIIIGIGAFISILQIKNVAQPKLTLDKAPVVTVEDVEIKLEQSEFIKKNSSDELENNMTVFDAEQDKRIIENKGE